MSNRELWRYYLESRNSLELGTAPSPLPGSPPYDNMNVVEAPQSIPLQQTQRFQYQTPLVPGPIRQVQIGLFHRMSHDTMVARGESSQTRSTQEFIWDVYNEPHVFDLDFTTHRWNSTIEYLRSEGSFTNRTRPFWTQVADIQCPADEFVKVKKIVAMISTITLNGQGDLLVTLKDPSGKINGSMHRNIFLNDEYRLATSVGTVVIARNVTVSRFNSASKYLNITARNIVKIIGGNEMVARFEANTNDEFAIIPDSGGDE